MHTLHHKTNTLTHILSGVIVLLIFAIGYGYYLYNNLDKKLQKLEEDSSLSIQTLEKNLSDAKAENTYILEKFNIEQTKNEAFASQIQDISSTIGKLDKLSKTDKELLQKYSKVFFLNEHYIPESLTSISSDYVFQKDKEQKIHTKVAPYLEKMLREAKSAGVSIQVISAFRSFGEQGSLKNDYTFTYGSGANKFSADQGYSEHQLGTTLDFTTPELGSSFEQFAVSQSYKWLQENAYSYYTFEPWHWRFVGERLALRLHNEGENFYDMEQREIDNYLINIFD